MESFKSSEADPNLMETQRAILKSLSTFKDRKDLNNNQKEQNTNKVEAIEWNQYNKENMENSLEKTVEKAMGNIGVKMEVKLEKMILKLVKTENEALEDRIKRHIDTRLGQLKSKLEISIGGELGNLKAGMENCVETGYNTIISNMSVVIENSRLKNQIENTENKLKIQKSMAASYNNFSNNYVEQKSDTPKTTNTFFSTKTNENEVNEIKIEQNKSREIKNLEKTQESETRNVEKSSEPSPEQVKTIVQNMVKELSLNKVKNCDKMGDASESEKSEKTDKSSTEFGLDSESSGSSESGSEKSGGKSEVLSGLTTSSSESESSGSDGSDLSLDEKKTFLSGLKYEKPKPVDSKVKAFVENELKMKKELKAESNAYSDFKSVSSSSSTSSSGISKFRTTPVPCYPTKQETVNKIDENKLKKSKQIEPKLELKSEAQNQGWQTLPVPESVCTESAISEKITLPKIADWRCATSQNSNFDGKLMVKFTKADIEDIVNPKLYSKFLLHFESRLDSKIYHNTDTTIFLPIQTEWNYPKSLMKFTFSDLDRGLPFMIYQIFKNYEDKIDFEKIPQNEDQILNISSQISNEADFKLRVKRLNTKDSYFRENVTKKTLRHLLESIWTALFKKIHQFNQEPEKIK